jgi:hypothetical protein
MPVKHLLAVLALLSLSQTLSAQEASDTIQVKKPRNSYLRRYLNKFVKDSTDKEKPQFLYYPTIAYAPETQWEFGISGIFMGYAKRDTTNRLSEVSGFVFVTTAQQYGGYIDHALYSHRNTWFALGKLKVQSFPLSYYGIGHNTAKQKLASVEAFSINWKERFLRKIAKDFYIGLELDWQLMTKVNFVDAEGATYQRPFGSGGSSNLGVGLGVVFDNRHNVLNVRDGFMGELAWLRYTKALGSIANFSTFFWDSRYFIPIRQRNVLAFQALGQFSIGEDIPFNQLALLGGEMMHRGYYLGRFRDRNYLSFQVEYRMLPFSFAKRFGAGVFAASGLIYDRFSNITAQHLKYSGGFGLHYLIFPKKDVWTRIDLALNNELGWGGYFFMGCAF